MAPFIFWNLAFYTIIRTQLHMERLDEKKWRKMRNELVLIVVKIITGYERVEQQVLPLNKSKGF